MATDTERFTSKFRKERIEQRRERTERRNKAFETTEVDGKEPSDRSTPSIGISVTSSARSTGRSSREAGKGEAQKSELESVTARISRLKVGDDKDGSDDMKPRHEDSHDEVERDRKHLQKKERGAGATTSKKRQQRKHLREKRRSTGVVIMPNMEGDGATAGEEANKVKENTYQNETMNANEAQGRGGSSAAGDEYANCTQDELIQTIEAYKQAINEWSIELEKSHKEIDSLRNENQRLRDENSSLLKVVNQLSTPLRK